MADAPDPVTVALTGQLPFYLLLAAILTWPVALGLLGLYKRAVRRSMRRSGSRASATAAAPMESPANLNASTQIAVPATLYNLPNSKAAGEADALLSHLFARPRHAALVYASAVVAYASIMAVAQVVADGLQLRPLQFLFLMWVFAWPAVLTTTIVAAATRAGKVVLVASYFAVLLALGGISIALSPKLTWSQVVLAWTMFDLPPTILLLTCLSRRVRAVGPLVLTFMLLALAGSHVAITIVGSDERLLRWAIDVTDVVGLGGVGTFWALNLLGFLLFAVVGWIALGWIRRQYQAKRISDQSVTIDAIVMLFAVAHSINLAFSHPLWTLTGLVAFAAYKVCVRAGLKWAGRDALAQRNPTLLVLRSFSIGKDGERLFDVVDRFWRRVGTIEMIAGIDLAHRTIEPHEFLDFVSGKLSRRFIDGPAVMEQRLRERDTRPDRDRRFRVNDYFCYDDTWRMVLSRLVRESDAVLMDLRGFSHENAGCVFELKELARMVPLERVVFVVDRRTDEKLLAETLGDCRAGVYRLDSLTIRRVRELMRSLASAAAPMEPTTA